MKGSAAVISALRYELLRMRSTRSTRNVALLALVASAILTLPAARQVVGLAHPMPPGTQPALLQRLMGHSLESGGGAWVVAGGVVGMVLPGAVAACAAAWLGASAVRYEYRFGGGLLAFALVPRRFAVLVGKALVAACFGLLLSAAGTVVAYGIAHLGFAVAGTQVAMPPRLMTPAPRGLAMAALGGALGTFGAAVLRLRALATAVAVAGCTAIDALIPRTTSPVLPYLTRAAQYGARSLPGVTATMVQDFAVGLPPLVLVLAGAVAVRRRRVV